MKISALLLTLIPSCALAQGVRYEPLAPMYRPLGPNAALSPVVARYVWDRSGPMLEEPGGTVSHVYWNGSALVDTKSLAWTMQGTVPQVGSSILYPDGFAGASRPGAGPFSDANYYKLGTGADALDFAGDFYFCFTFKTPTVLTDTKIFLGNGAYQAEGYYLGTRGAKFYIASSTTGSERLAESTTALVAGDTNVACAGRAGGNHLVKLNGDTLITLAAHATAGATTPAMIGRYVDAGLSSTPIVYEMLAVEGTPSDATFTAIQKRFASLYAQKPPTSTVTWTRAASQSCQPVAGGVLGTVPAGAPCVGANGAGVWGAVTHALLNNRDLTTWGTGGGGGVAAPTVTAGADQIAGQDEQVKADKIVFPEVTGAGAFSTAFKIFTGTAAGWSTRVALKGSASGTAYISMTPDGSTYRSKACTFTATAWTTCELANQTLSAASWYWQIGVDLRDSGQVAQPAQTIWVDIPDAYASATIAPVAEVGATPVLSVADAPTVASAIALGARPMMRAEFTLAGLPTGGGTTAFAFLAEPFNSASDRWDFYVQANGKVKCEYYNGTVYNLDSTATVTPGVATTASCSYDGSSLKVCVGDVCDTAARTFAPSETFSSAYVANDQGTSSFLNGYLKSLVLCKAERGCH